MKNLSYVIEIFVSLAVLTLINFIWFRDNPGFYGVSPHPYWIIVIGISIKYELKQSLVASFASSLIYGISLFAFHELSLAEVLEFEAYQLVFLLIISSILMGKVRSGQVKKVEELIKEKNSLEDLNLRLQERNNKVVKVNSELSDRIFHQTYSYSTVYEMMKKIRNISMRNLYTEALEFISDAIEVEKCSLYIYRSGQFELHTALGWGEQDRNRSALINSNPLVQQVLRTKEIRAVNDFLDDLEDELPLSIEYNVVISVPIIYGHEKRIIGIINIEKIPFSRFNSDSFSLLKVVSDWISDSHDAYEPLTYGKMNQHQDVSEYPLNGNLNIVRKPVYRRVE